MIKINIYSTKNINIVSTIISIIILLIINLLVFNFPKNNNPQKNNEQIFSKNIKEENRFEEDEKTQEKYDWYLEISSINLIAPIKETTEMNILKKYVGHFEETPFRTGNVGLAGHNRGYENNYFEDLKDVRKGEKIKYKYYDFEKTYIIDKIEIIKSTNWSYLENTKENKITLITCVNNKPNDRLCVQATEEKEIIE